jgi:hypothetical protein
MRPLNRRTSPSSRGSQIYYGGCCARSTPSSAHRKATRAVGRVEHAAFSETPCRFLAHSPNQDACSAIRCRCSTCLVQSEGLYHLRQLTSSSGGTRRGIISIASRGANSCRLIRYAQIRQHPFSLRGLSIACVERYTGWQSGLLRAWPIVRTRTRRECNTRSWPSYRLSN